MKQKQQDALAYVTNYGSPDFFITFTMNPSWPEFEDTLIQLNSKSKNRGDRPDQSIFVFPKITEEEAIRMIMPDEFYRDDDSEETQKGEVTEAIEELKEELKQELKEEFQVHQGTPMQDYQQ